MSYQTFLKKLRSQLNKIPQDSERKKRYQIIVCNWKIGELIVCEHFIEGNAPRNEHLFERLSRDLGKNKRFL